MDIFRRHKPYVAPNGYKYHYNPKSPDANCYGYAPVHRDVARKALGRDFKPNEVVHHIDGNKLNNRKNNLKVMTDSEHYKLHNLRLCKRKSY